MMLKRKLSKRCKQWPKFNAKTISYPCSNQSDSVSLHISRLTEALIDIKSWVASLAKKREGKSESSHCYQRIR